MRVTCQIICYVVTLLALLFLGSLFDTAFRQTGFHAAHLLGGKPLPRITEFLISHHHLPGYIVLFPWLAFVGAPLFSSPATRDFWEPSGFFLRFAAFLATEAFILLLFVFAIALPFIPYYGVMEDSRESTSEFTVRLAFWGAVCLVVVAAIVRFYRYRRRPA